MRLGTETGSLINHVMSRTNQPMPTIGMGATILCWTDRHAATIVDVNKSGKRITVQEDRAKRIDKNGLSEIQEYEYTPDPTAAYQVFSLRKNGSWVRVGGSTRLRIGYRSAYHDFSF